MSPADWLTLENDTRAAVYSRDFRYSSVDTCDNTIATNYCNLRLFGIAQPGAAAGSFDPTLTLAQHRRQRALSAEQLGRAGHRQRQCRFPYRRIPQRADRRLRRFLPALRPHHLCLQPADPAQYTYPLGDHTATRRNIGWSLYHPTHQPIAGYAPILPTPTNLGSDTATSVLYSSGEATDLALFATDRFWFTEDVSLIAGVRIDQYRANYPTTTVGTAPALSGDHAQVAVLPVRSARQPGVGAGPDPDLLSLLGQGGDADRHLGGGIDLRRSHPPRNRR